jgi:hypothetical protein
VGECGCSYNNDYYILPARSGLVYLLTLSPKCEGCDAPPGITIERFKGQKHLMKHMGFDELPPQLPFSKWMEWEGVAIITGYRKHEFVKAAQNHLIGVSSKEMGKAGRIDSNGAEVILEEMYIDAAPPPTIVEPSGALSQKARLRRPATRRR